MNKCAQYLVTSELERGQNIFFFVLCINNLLHQKGEKKARFTTTHKEPQPDNTRLTKLVNPFLTIRSNFWRFKRQEQVLSL